MAKEDYFKKIQENSENIISTAVKQYEKMGKAPKGDIFDYHFAKITPILKEQKEKFLSEVK